MSDSANTAPPLLQRTALFDLHLELGAKMVGFAGYELPIQYPLGVLKEHLQTRQSAGVFDVSHMGQLLIRAKSGRLEDAKVALEKLVPADIVSLAQGRQRYSQLTNSAGGIIDDLMISNLTLSPAITGLASPIETLYLVVNGACKVGDMAHIQKHLAPVCDITPLPQRSLIAIQGPLAVMALAEIFNRPEMTKMKFMDNREMNLGGHDSIVSRSGYTGEDGVEVSVASSEAVDLTRKILSDSRIQPIGLGARDSLRLEAGLCLYGNDIDETISPIEAGLQWSIQKSRRSGGERAGGFAGSDIILKQMEQGVSRLRVGLKPDGRAPIRGETLLFATEDSTESLGRVTSGGFGPTVNAPVAMGLVAKSHSQLGTRLFAEVRGQRMAVTVVDPTFVEHHFYRS
ncbi:MAG: glycine cleavage system aminomethyltransferase GcvT [Candidatus Pacebacteria bacterium]|nr:glycine cleavage system aminomethyltransferase GcvT [Candidatus Paceibacterota bacterium]